jgi:hypothetical protein
MNWRNIESVIQGDLDAEKFRQQREILRSTNISDGWLELWERTISCLSANAVELDKKLQSSRILGLGNNLGVMEMDQYHHILQNPAFPRIRLDIHCKPGRSIIISGEKSPSAYQDMKIYPLLFNFEVDRDYRPYLAGENSGCFSPSQLADLLLDKVAEFFRGVATR